MILLSKVSGSRKIWWLSLSLNLWILSSREGQYLGPLDFICPLNIGDLCRFISTILCVSWLVWVMWQQICFVFIASVKNENGSGFSSPYCFWHFKKFIDSARSRGGVPVFNRSVLKLFDLKKEASLIEGLELILPADQVLSPWWITPLKNVPEVIIVLAQ